MPIKTGAEAINEAMVQILSESPDYFVIGEGVPDPKACFGTTKGLSEKFPKQVFDMPVSENGVTGVCVGAAAAGLRPIMVHMRVDFLMYAMDQIVNMAAKLHFMYGGQLKCPMVIRAIVGRGWGQGCQHSQHLEEMFAMVPGLKVVMPSNPYNAKGLLVAAARDNNSVIYLEHRWIHSMTGEVPDEIYEVPIGQSRVARGGGKDMAISFITQGYMVSVALKAAEFLSKQGISCEVVDRQTILPWHMGNSNTMSEQKYFSPCPPAPNLSKNHYTGIVDIMLAVSQRLDKKIDFSEAEAYEKSIIHDIPHKDFMGPF